MAESLTIARPYADAAFKLAVETNSLPDWSDAFTRLAAVMRAGEAQALIANPRVSAENVGKVLHEVAGKLSKEQRNFVQILAENDRLSVLPEIATQFEEKRNRHEERPRRTSDLRLPADGAAARRHRRYLAGLAMVAR